MRTRTRPTLLREPVGYRAARAEPGADLPTPRAGLGPRSPREGPARGRLCRPRDRRGDGRRRGDPAAGAIRFRPGPSSGEPARLPALRPADRAGRERLRILRTAPAGPRRIVVIRRIAVLGAIATVIAASGCGSDESGETTAPTVS